MGLKRTTYGDQEYRATITLSVKKDMANIQSYKLKDKLLRNGVENNNLW